MVADLQKYNVVHIIFSFSQFKIIQWQCKHPTGSAGILTPIKSVSLQNQVQYLFLSKGKKLWTSIKKLFYEESHLSSFIRHYP